MKILVLNAGSSSIKFQLFSMVDSSVMASGLVEQIGENESNARIKFNDNQGSECKKEIKGSIPNHEAALKIMSTLLIESGVIKDLNELDGIGH